MAVAHPATVGMSLADCPDSAAGDCYPLCPAFIPPQCLTATIAYSKSLTAQPSPHSKSCPPLPPPKKKSNRRPPLYSVAWGQAELKRTKCSFVFNGQVRKKGHDGFFLFSFSFSFRHWLRGKPRLRADTPSVVIADQSISAGSSLQRR